MSIPNGATTGTVDAIPLTHAYHVCERLARAHDENFPVASRLLPARMRLHIAAIYAFARTADDFADEGHVSAARRLELLEDWRERLHRCAGGATVVSPSRGSSSAVIPGPRHSDGSADADAMFVALGNTVRVCSLPVTLLDDLLSAFRQDVTTGRYATWDDLFGYCRRSANPVGRLVLRIAGYDDATMDEASDALCTALQLTNFWQDLAIDWRRGRLYVPATDVRECGAQQDDLTTGTMSAAWRQVLERAAARTRAWFDAGRPVCDHVHGRLALELRLTWLGGMRVLERLERAQFDVFSRRPTLGMRDAPLLIYRALRWHARARL